MITNIKGPIKMNPKWNELLSNESTFHLIVPAILKNSIAYNHLSSRGYSFQMIIQWVENVNIKMDAGLILPHRITLIPTYANYNTSEEVKDRVIKSVVESQNRYVKAEKVIIAIDDPEWINKELFINEIFSRLNNNNLGNCSELIDVNLNVS